VRFPPSRALQALAVAHAGVGVGKYHRQLRGVVDDGVVGALGGDPERRTAFWFLSLSPLLWLTGRLLRDAEATGDHRAQRITGAVLVGTGAVGVGVLPKSPFWALLATGAVSALRPRDGRPVPPPVH
jgi:hypothetical protein